MKLGMKKGEGIESTVAKELNSSWRLLKRTPAVKMKPDSCINTEVL